jgi:hypothetical protein
VYKPEGLALDSRQRPLPHAMAEQPQPPDLSGLSSEFRSATENLTHEWGFVVVRTAYAADNDEAQWAAALEKLRAYATPNNDDAEMDPNTFALPVIADSTLLRNADYASVRKAFNGWVDDFVLRENDGDSDQDEQWPSDLRRDAFIVIDHPALSSLLSAPDFIPGEFPPLDQEPWVVVVDAADPASESYNGGGPYMGFTRAHASALDQLFDDLKFRSLARLSPVRKYDGQIPLYNGDVWGELVDPDGGVDGRYQFPKGTPRGVQGARAMLSAIEQALGVKQVY